MASASDVTTVVDWLCRLLWESQPDARVELPRKQLPGVSRVASAARGEGEGPRDGGEGEGGR